MTHLGEPYPHEGGCRECQDDYVCSNCGAELNWKTRCTNGRCAQCHRTVCAPGGDTSSGHGYWREIPAKFLRVRGRFIIESPTKGVFDEWVPTYERAPTMRPKFRVSGTRLDGRVFTWLPDAVRNFEKMRGIARSRDLWVFNLDSGKIVYPADKREG